MVAGGVLGISSAFWFSTSSAAVLAVLVTAVTAQVAAAQPAAPVLQAQAFGQTVVASWTAVPGATSYRVEAGLTATQVLGAYEVGALTGFSLAAPQGTYYLRVFARNALGLSSPSNIVGVTVTSALPPPPPPSALVASVAGSTVNFSVQLPASGITGLVLAAGIAPGQTLAILPLPVAPQTSVQGVPPGTYFARMHTVGPGGPSTPSNEVQLTVGASACTPPGVPTVQGQASGSTVAISWSAVAGAAGYQVVAAMSPGGAPLYAQAFPAGTNSVSYPGVPAGTYYVRVTASNACGVATSADAAVVVTPPVEGARTPNPPAPTPPNYLPLPNRWAVVDQMSRLYPNELRNSCGDNTWLFRLVQRLRQEDTRWGLNWKRSNVGDMSQDAITYNYGPQADEGTRYVHVVDVIGGHCGGNPSAAWIDQTVLWTTGATWTLQPYSAAGYPR